MERVTDWINLWRELAEAQARSWSDRKGDKGKEGDAWRTKARSFDAKIRERWSSPDSSRQTVVDRLRAQPGASVLDIGAGTGAWACLLARHARLVTAVEPSTAMIEVMQENLAAEGIENVRIVQESWPDVEVQSHDFSLCSHAMYGTADLPAFVGQMMRSTRRTCFLVLRVPTAGGLMAQVATRVWGQPYDSPNFQVAYNALLQMGLFPNVVMEDTGLWQPWTNASLEEALVEISRRFGLGAQSEHTAFLEELLRQQLVRREGQYVWPQGVRSALVYWDVEPGMSTPPPA